MKKKNTFASFHVLKGLQMRSCNIRAAISAAILLCEAQMTEDQHPCNGTSLHSELKCTNAHTYTHRYGGLAYETDFFPWHHICRELTHGSVDTQPAQVFPSRIVTPGLHPTDVTLEGWTQENWTSTRKSVNKWNQTNSFINRMSEFILTWTFL